jgi:methyl-accepting chemotaxis protein
MLPLGTRGVPRTRGAVIPKRKHIDKFPQAPSYHEELQEVLMRIQKSGAVTFIVISAAVISIFSVILAVTLLRIQRTEDAAMRRIILDESSMAAYSKSKSLFRYLADSKILTVEQAGEAVKTVNSPENDITAITIFSKTQDENYYRVKYTYSRGGDIYKLKINDEVKESSENNMLKNGSFEVTTDAKLYSDGNSYWFNIYAPVTIGKSLHVIMLSYNASDAVSSYDLYVEKTKKYHYAILAAMLAFICIIMVLSLIFSHNLNLFIASLTGVVKKAANGELDIRMNENADSDITELAMSFNSLIGEMKEKEKIISELAAKDSLNDMFKFGVNLLKENRLDESETIFKSLLLLKPEGFGSYFNLGVIYAKTKRFESSLEMLRRALELNSGHEQTKNYIAKISALIAKK